MSAIIQLENVKFSYRGAGGPPALREVNLSLEHGCFCSIIGPNGGGKSTLLKLLLGVLSPDSGTVRVLGMPPEKARLKIGYMPQSHELDLAFPIRNMEVVLMGRLHRNFFGRFGRVDLRKAIEAMDAMGVSSLRDKLFSELSGGQRQRVLMARALACEPEILLLDEPTANIDPGAEEQFYTMLGKLHEKMTMLTVSHDLGFVQKEVDTVVCVNRIVSVHEAKCLTGELLDSVYNYHMHPVSHAPGCCGIGEHLHHD